MSQRQQAQHELSTVYCYRCMKHWPREDIAPRRKHATRPMCKKCDSVVHAQRTLVDARVRKNMVRPAIPWGD